MKIKLLTPCIFLLCMLSASTAFTQKHAANGEVVSIIPEPLRLEVLKGTFELTRDTKIYVDDQNQDLRAVGEQLSDHLLAATGFKLPLTAGSPESASGIILLATDNVPDSLGAEGYILEVSPETITIRAKEARGVFYGVQTLYQLLPLTANPGSPLEVPAVSITDKPRFAWRGMMLDVGRYFYTVDFIKKFIDYLAMHKMNTFHWHLTEDHGWRIEIKKYPRLTEVGSTRKGTQRSHDRNDVDHTTHSGYYTQEQVKEVIAYAQKRYVTVVPEIEMPGHSLAALAAYPQLSCTGGPFEMPLYWGIRKDIYCAGNEETFHFLEGVLSEVAALFPSPVFHIGGDEAPKDRWKACPKCQARIKAEGLKDEHELQSYFIKRIEKFLLTKNKRIIGWDEILEGGLAPNAAVMSWRGIKGGIAAAKQQHDVVMTPTSFMYFDYYQANPETEPVAIGGYLPLEKVYSYEPVPAELSPDEAQYIKGVQGNVWSEFIHAPDKVEYMAYPRALALSEIAWSPASVKDYEHFLQKLPHRLAALDEQGLNFRIPEPAGLQDLVTTEKMVRVRLEPLVAGAEIFYTTDGTEPDKSSNNYVKPVKLSLAAGKPVQLKTIQVLPSGRASSTYTAIYTRKAFLPALSVQPEKKGVSFKAVYDRLPSAKDISLSAADTSGVLPAFDIEQLTPRPMGVVYQAYFLAEKEGMYTFSIRSDDGVVCYVDDELVIENDGEHGVTGESGTVPLRKGYHKIRLQYFDAGGGRHLEMNVSDPSGDYPLSDKLFTAQDL